MSTPARVTPQTIYRRVLWALAITSWIASTAIAIALLAAGVQLRATVILGWTMLVAHITISAMIVSCIPSAEAIASRAYAAALTDRGDDDDELAVRRGG